MKQEQSDGGANKRNSKKKRGQQNKNSERNIKSKKWKIKK
jgi:hypothetical protein